MVSFFLLIFLFETKSVSVQDHPNQIDVIKTTPKIGWNENFRLTSFSPNVFGVKKEVVVDHFPLSDLDMTPFAEMAVHYAAAYLPGFSITRALVIGDATGLALAQLVKYPSLQRVDVIVNEAAPNDFATTVGVDLHLQDEKVRWIIGNPASTVETEILSSADRYQLIIVHGAVDPELVHQKLSLKLSESGVLVATRESEKVASFWKSKWFFRSGLTSGVADHYVLCSDFLRFDDARIDLQEWEKFSISNLQLQYYKPAKHYQYTRDFLALWHSGKEPLLDNQVKPHLHFGHRVLASVPLTIQDEHCKLDIVEFQSNVFGFKKTVLFDGVPKPEMVDPEPYYELLVHFPMVYFDTRPERVLVLGGFDGAAVNQLLKWSTIEHVDVVIESRQLHDAMESYSGRDFPDSPKVSWNFDGANNFLLQRFVNASLVQHKYDLILVDAGFSEGPLPLSRATRVLLNEGGVVGLNWRKLNLLDTPRTKQQISQNWNFQLRYKYHSPTCGICHLLLLSHSNDLYRRIDQRVAKAVFHFQGLELKHYNIDDHFGYFSDWRQWVSKGDTLVNENIEKTEL